MIFETETRSVGSLTKGDSYGKIITSAGILFDAGWSGTWTISTDIGSAALLSGNLEASIDQTQMICSITKAQTATLSVGDYYLLLHVENVDGFSKRVLTETLTVNA